MKKLSLFLFFLLTLFLNQGIAQNKNNDPDLPKLGNISKEDYLKGRESYINLKRGFLESLPYNARLKALSDMRNNESKNSRRTATALPSPNWVELGPSPIPNGQTDSAELPVSGRVTAIAIHPTNANIVYVGTANGGVFRTMDGGSTWTAIFDGAASLAIGALAIPNSDPTILYVGTGESNLSQDSYIGVGLYRIDHADATPSLVGPINPPFTYTSNASTTVTVGTFSYRAISKILVDPTNAANIFVSTTSGLVGNPGTNPFSGIPPKGILGIYRSNNATAALNTISFQKLTVTTTNSFDNPGTGDRPVTDMVMEPGNPNNIVCWIYGTTAVNDGGIYRTTNAMAANPSFVQTWRDSLTNSNRGALTVVKEGSAVVIYAASGESSTGTGCSGNSGAVRKSSNGGQTWSNKLHGGGGFCGGQCFYDITIAVSPIDSNRILLGGSATNSTGCEKIMQVSSNGGASYAHSGNGLHADSHTLAFAPSNTNIVYTGNDGGIFKSTDGGFSWNSVNTSNFKATQFQSLALHPVDTKITIGGTQDNGTNMMMTDGSFKRVDYGDGGFSAIDQSSPDIVNFLMYHTYFNQRSNLIGYASTNGGINTLEGDWNFYGCYNDTGVVNSHNGIGCTDNTLFYAPLVLGPGKPNIIYFGTDRLYRSADSGSNNLVVSQAPIETGNSGGIAITSIAVSKSNDSVRIVGLLNGDVWKTTTASTTLVNSTPPVSKLNEVGHVVYDSIAKIAYVAYGGYGLQAGEHVWKCTNLSAATPTWTKAGTGIPDVPVNAFVFDPSNSQVLYAGTDIGVFQSQDGGNSWASYSAGLPAVPIFDMAIHPVTKVLRIATHGRGLWETVTQSPLPVTFISLTATPQKFGKVFLEWFTSSEFNNKGFELQRATNNGVTANVNWEDIAFVSGAGNSSNTLRYNYDDYPSGGNKFLYRIKQIDNDGHFKYSDIRNVELRDFDYAVFQNIPNPASISTLIKYQLPIGGNVNISVYNTLGVMIKTLVNENKQPGIYEIRFNTAALPSGTYYYKMVSGDFNLTKSMSISK